MPACAPGRIRELAGRARPTTGDVPRQSDLGGEPLPGHQGSAGRSAPVREDHSGRHHADGCRQQHSGDVRADRRSRASSVAAHADQQLHLQALRSDAAADSGNGRPISRRDDRQRAAGRPRARLRLASAVTGDRAATGCAARRPGALPAPHHGRTGHEVVRRAEGAGLRGNVCLHPGIGGSQRARTRR